MLPPFASVDVLAPAVPPVEVVMVALVPPAFTVPPVPRLDVPPTATDEPPVEVELAPASAAVPPVEVEPAVFVLPATDVSVVEAPAAPPALAPAVLDAPATAAPPVLEAPPLAAPPVLALAAAPASGSSTLLMVHAVTRAPLDAISAVSCTNRLSDISMVSFGFALAVGKIAVYAAQITGISTGTR